VWGLGPGSREGGSEAVFALESEGARTEGKSGIMGRRRREPERSERRKEALAAGD